MHWNNEMYGKTRIKLAAILLVGFLSLAVLAALIYSSTAAIVRMTDFCSPWIDIPGRIALFIIFYYLAGICGYLPIPERFMLYCFPVPLLWKLKTWRKIFRKCLPSSRFVDVTNEDNLRLPLIQEERKCSPSSRFVDATNEDNLRLPLIQEERKCSPSSRFADATNEDNLRLPLIQEQHNCENLFTTRRRSEPTQISYSEDRVAPVPFRTVGCPRNECLDTIKSSDESFMAFESPIAGFIVPMVKGKSSKPRYLTDSDMSNSTAHFFRHRAATKTDDVRDTTDEWAESVEQKGAAKSETERPDTPPKTPEVEIQLPDYPRLPWALLKNSGAVPKGAVDLHKKNLRIERRKVQNYARKQKTKGLLEEPESSTDVGWETKDDEGATLKNKPFELPQRKFGRQRSRRQTRTTLEDLNKLHPIKLHRNCYSDSSDQSNRFIAGSSSNTKSEQTKEQEKFDCCERSPNLHLKVEYIQRVLHRISDKASENTDEQLELPEN